MEIILSDGNYFDDWCFLFCFYVWIKFEKQQKNLLYNLILKGKSVKTHKVIFKTHQKKFVPHMGINHTNVYFPTFHSTKYLYHTNNKKFIPQEFLCDLLLIQK